MRREEIAAREFLRAMRREWANRNLGREVHNCPILAWEEQTSKDRGALVAAMRSVLKAIEPEEIERRAQRAAERAMEETNAAE